MSDSKHQRDGLSVAKRMLGAVILLLVPIPFVVFQVYVAVSAFTHPYGGSVRDLHSELVIIPSIATYFILAGYWIVKPERFHVALKVIVAMGVIAMALLGFIILRLNP